VKYKNLIIAVDFDGTLCVDDYPRIGEPNLKTVEFVKRAIKNGSRVILHTCRAGRLPPS
jgi:hydroxymethylpyrimidine pyrophosphatase-like HAD family hydrolase